MYIILGVVWLLGAFALTAAGNQGMNIAVGGALLLVAVLGYCRSWPRRSSTTGTNRADSVGPEAAGAGLLVVGGTLSEVGRGSATA